MIKVAFADDSALLRKVLRDVFGEKKNFTIIWEAKNGEEAVNNVKKEPPDILILDCEMPVMTGLEALRKIMAENPIPVFMFSSLTDEGSSVTIKALEYGAVDFLLKPTKGLHSLEEISDDLVKKIQHIVTKERAKSSFSRIKTEPKKVLPVSKELIDIVAIGSSTGGVQAAHEIVKNFPEQTKPIVWVQHMPPSFTNSFATRLDKLSKIKIKEASDGDILKNNTCYIAPGGYQMRVLKKLNNFVLKIEGEEKVSGHCPSCDVLFESVSELFNKNAIGVILTGMGSDGTKGLVKMKKKGSFVIGQNEDSCVVYGMPKAAYQAGAVNIELNISDIADAIIRKGG